MEFNPHLTLIQSRLCHCYLKYLIPTRQCQKWRITNYSLRIYKNGTSAPAFILLLPLVLTMEKSAGEFTNSLLHSCPCSAVLPGSHAAVWDRNFTSLHPRRTNLLPLTQREICLTVCYFKDIFHESKQAWDGLQWILTTKKNPLYSVT